VNARRTVVTIDYLCPRGDRGRGADLAFLRGHATSGA